MIELELLTIAQVAVRMQVSEGEVRRLVLQEKKLAAVFLGRKKKLIRIPRFAINEFARREIKRENQ